MRTSFNDNIRNPQLRAFAKEKGQFQGLTATAVKIEQNRLVEIASNEIQAATDDDANVIGATLEGSIASAGVGNIDFGVVEVLASGDFAILDKVAAAADGRVRKYLAAQVEMEAATTGTGFANQPAGDTVQVVSDDAGDTDTVTLYYTVTGATGVVASETLTLDGTTKVDTTSDAIEQVLAVVADAHDGTITVSEKSGSLAIDTLPTGTNSLGYNEVTTKEAYGAIPTVKCDAAATEWVGVIGVDVDGDALTAAVQLNGTSDVDLGSSPFDTVTYFLTGAVASDDDVTLETKAADSNALGIALEAGVSGSVEKIWVKPFGV